VIQSADAFPLASLTAFKRSGIGSGAAIVPGMFLRGTSPVQRQNSSGSPTYPMILAFSLADRLEGRGSAAALVRRLGRLPAQIAVRVPDWMPITPKTGSLFHADSHYERTQRAAALGSSDDPGAAGRGSD
jgi:hypothetical protein